MIKAALQYLVGMGTAEVFEENGQTYSDKSLHLLERPTASPFLVHTLSGLVDYLKTGLDRETDVFVHVVSPTEVCIESVLNNDAERDYFLKATALTPSFEFDYFYGTEDFNIKLQSCFVKNKDRDDMLKVVGNIQEKNVNTIGDDGHSQSVVAKTSVASMANVKVPNPVALAPYRTFVEVDQPVSEFIFRMQQGPRCAIFEADGGKWKLEAMKNIKKYLAEELQTEISTGTVHIIS